MKITAEHKRAFRLAYDALAAAGTPENSTAYFESTAEAMMRVQQKDPESKLLGHLLSAVYCYLDEAAKKK